MTGGRANLGSNKFFLGGGGGGGGEVQYPVTCHETYTGE